MQRDQLSKVSIVMSTYNGARYIRQSIDSCLGQTYKNTQLIIVDDGSTDNTFEIVSSYKDPRMRYVKHNRNMGMPTALNTGFANANGDYLTWTSDDNFYAPDAITKLISFLETQNCQFAYSDFYRFSDKNLSDFEILRLPDIPDLENKNCIGPCFLYSRNVHETVGEYDPDTFLAEDYDYWIRVSKTYSMHHLPEPLYYYRTHPQSLTTLKSREVKMMDILVRLKNDLLDAEHAAILLLNLTSSKYPSCFGANKVLMNIMFWRKIIRVTKDLEAGKMHLGEARSILGNVVTGDSLFSRDGKILRTLKVQPKPRV